MHLWIMIFFPLFPFYGLDHMDLEILLRELKRLGSGLCNWLDGKARGELGRFNSYTWL